VFKSRRDLLSTKRLVFIPIFLSIGVWASPLVQWFPAGFSRRSSLTVGGILVGAIWLIVLGAASGWRPSTPQRLAVMPLAQEVDSYLRCFVAVATVGFLGSFAIVAAHTNVLVAITTQFANNIDNALPDSAGIQTLRYAVAPAAGLALASALKSHRLRLIHVYSWILLLLTAVASARLLIILAGTIAVVLLDAWTPDSSIRIGRVFLLILAGFVLLTPFNYLRNAHYYREKGVTNPFAMNLAEMSTYLSSPAQVSIFVSAEVAEGSSSTKFGPSMNGMSAVLVPGFLRADSRNGKSEFNASFYGPGLDLRRALTTNSVFADMTAEYDWISSLAAAVLIGLSVRLVNRWRASPRLSHQLMAGVLIYPGLETWRIYLLTSGLILFLLLMIFGASILTKRSSWSKTLNEASFVDGAIGSLRK
jgi:hypothetical protein